MLALQPSARFSSTLSRSFALVNLEKLTTGERLDFDDQTYVIRRENCYIAYRNWMMVVPLVEVFPLQHKSLVIQWLEQFGYSFS
jgi:hypothetical protein